MSTDSEFFDQLRVRVRTNDLPPLKPSLTPEQLERYSEPKNDGLDELWQTVCDAERAAGRVFGEQHVAIRLLCEAVKGLITRERNKLQP